MVANTRTVRSVRRDCVVSTAYGAQDIGVAIHIPHSCMQPSAAICSQSAADQIKKKVEMEARAKDEARLSYAR